MPRRVAGLLAALVLGGCSHGSSAADPTTGLVASGPVTTQPVVATASSTPPTSASTPSPTTAAQGSATSAAPWVGPCGRTDQAPHTYDHVVWIWMENKNENKVLDAAAAPYFQSV